MIDRDTVMRLARQAVNSGDGSELSGDAIERFAQLVFLEAAAPQERYDFVLAACRDAQTLASRYGWALSEIAGMDADGKRADDLGRAARIARNALLGTVGVKGKS